MIERPLECHADYTDNDNNHDDDDDSDNKGDDDVDGEVWLWQLECVRTLSLNRIEVWAANVLFHVQLCVCIR